VHFRRWVHQGGGPVKHCPICTHLAMQDLQFHCDSSNCHLLQCSGAELHLYVQDLAGSPGAGAACAGGVLQDQAQVQTSRR
jgi:hypothetical protein